MRAARAAHPALANDDIAARRYKFQSSLGAFEDKTATLSDADTVWADVRHMHMREAIDKLMADFNRFMADNAGFKGCVLVRSLVRLLSFMRGCLLLWLPAFLPAFIHSFI